MLATKGFDKPSVFALVLLMTEGPPTYGQSVSNEIKNFSGCRQGQKTLHRLNTTKTLDQENEQEKIGSNFDFQFFLFSFLADFIYRALAS